MRQPTKHTAAFVLLSLLASLLAVTTTAGTASAAESIPALQWRPVQASNSTTVNLTSPTGSVTVPCSTARGGSDLKTYSATGTLTQDISRTSIIDGVGDCIHQPAVDKNGDDYGVPTDPSTGTVGRNLLAYTGNTLKWKYPAYCNNDQPTQVAVGADGNIYATTYESDGVHLIGLTPNVASGQTQPTKVLDVKIQNDCSTMLYPYKYGIMLHGQSSGNGRYYSYSGKYLGQASIGDIWGEKLNADGRLFVTKTVTSSYRSISVTAYDPTTGQPAWTTTASSPGADAQSALLRPMPGGGVAVLVGEQQMLSSGIPASPTVYVKTLTIINGGGQVVLNQQFPNSDAHGNAYTGTYIEADNTSKVAVARIVNLSTGLSSPTTEPGISIQVYDSVTKIWTYSAVMSGDNSKTGGPYGYWFDSQEDNSMVFATNTLFFDAYCMGNCTDTLDRLYPVNVGGVGNDYPRSDVLTASAPVQPALVPYVALGDSYSSGQGAGVYDAGTTGPAPADSCYQSMNAYGRVMNRDPASELMLTAFAACGGAVTTDIYKTSTYPGVPFQDTTLSSATKVVTLTIGGNDIGFKDVITSCITVVNCDSQVNTAEAKIASVGPILAAAYNDVLSKAPNAQVYVIGYPPIVTADSNLCTSVSQIGYPFILNQKVQARQVLDKLNSAIATTIIGIEAKNSRLHYINATASNSPFNGHDVCSATPYFNGLLTLPAEQAGSFHPNAEGQQAYATLIESQLP